MPALNSLGATSTTVRYCSSALMTHGCVIRPEQCLSAMVVSLELKNRFPEFLTAGGSCVNLVKFIRQRLALSRKSRSKMVA